MPSQPDQPRTPTPAVRLHSPFNPSFGGRFADRYQILYGQPFCAPIGDRVRMTA